MFVHGMIGGVLSTVITIAYFVITVAVFQWDFYLLPPGAG